MGFRFLGIDVRIEPMFWLFLLFFVGMDASVESLIAGVVMFVSLLVHEYGHAMTALFFGARAEIVLEMFGGRAVHGRLSAKQDFLVTLNGPLLECVLIVVPYALLNWDGFGGGYYVRYFLYVMMRLNVLWVGLNLLPLEPLDGGKIARYVLDRWFGERGERMCVYLGLGCVGVVAPILFFKGFFFFGCLLVIFGMRNYQGIAGRGFVKMSEYGRFQEGVEAARREDYGRAKRILKRLLRSKDARMRGNAMEALARVLHRAGEGERAYGLLLKADRRFLREGKCLLSRLAFERGNFELVVGLAREVYEVEPTVQVALRNARAFGKLGKWELAKGWLKTVSLFDEVEMDVVLSEKCFQGVLEK